MSMKKLLNLFITHIWVVILGYADDDILGLLADSGEAIKKNQSDIAEQKQKLKLVKTESS